MVSIIAGCASKSDSEGTSTESNEESESTESTKVVMAAQATSGQVFQYMADEKGYLKDLYRQINH